MYVSNNLWDKEFSKFATWDEVELVDGAGTASTAESYNSLPGNEDLHNGSWKYSVSKQSAMPWSLIRFSEIPEASSRAGGSV